MMTDFDHLNIYDEGYTTIKLKTQIFLCICVRNDGECCYKNIFKLIYVHLFYVDVL